MKMLVSLFLMCISVNVVAGRDVPSSTIHYVYQLDSDPTVFEFNSTVINDCGSSLYRVKSPTESVANRKFSLVLSAFLAGKKLAFHDTGLCEGDRSVVAWVRLIN